MNTEENLLSIPIGKARPAEYARSLRKNLLLLHRRMFESITDADDFDKKELESSRAVLDLVILLQEIEDRASTPP